jgi:hypothetical protein
MELFTSIQGLTENESASNTETFRDYYAKKFKSDNSETVSKITYSDLQDLFFKTRNEFDHLLTAFQIDLVNEFFMALNRLTEMIDPDRAKFKCGYNEEDEDFLIYRNTSKAIYNIVICDDECFALSYSPKNSTEKGNIEIFRNKAEMENVVYRFFSK